MLASYRIPRLAVLQEAQASNGDDWNLPSNKPNTNDNKKDKKKKPKEEDDNSFQTSLTFIPQQDLADPKLMKILNSPWNDKAKKEKLEARLQGFVRDNMLDQERIDLLFQRTRKEWEDMDVKLSTSTLQAMAKIVVGILSSPGVRKLLDDRDAQAKILSEYFSLKIV